MKLKRYNTYLPADVIEWLHSEKERTELSICRIIAKAVRKAMEATK